MSKHAKFETIVKKEKETVVEETQVLGHDYKVKPCDERVHIECIPHDQNCMCTIKTEREVQS